jgi:hypothetical protein
MVFGRLASTSVTTYLLGTRSAARYGSMTNKDGFSLGKGSPWINDGVGQNDEFARSIHSFRRPVYGKRDVGAYQYRPGGFEQ